MDKNKKILTKPEFPEIIDFNLYSEEEKESIYDLEMIFGLRKKGRTKFSRRIWIAIVIIAIAISIVINFIAQRIAISVSFNEMAELLVSVLSFSAVSIELMKK